MSTQNVRSYIWDDVECLPRPKMEKLQVERLRAEIDRVSEIVPFYKKKCPLICRMASFSMSICVANELPWYRRTIKKPWPLIAKNAGPIFQLEAPAARRRGET